MGSCLSKSTPATREIVQKADFDQAATRRRTDAAQTRHPSLNDVREQGSPELPAEVAAWSAADVGRWAASLGLPKASIDALQGVTGLQLLLLTDQRLLQLGVQDAAERHALLAARSSLQQHGAILTKTQQITVVKDEKAAIGQSEDALRHPPAGALAAHTVGVELQPDSVVSKGASRFGLLQGSRTSTDGGAASVPQPPASVPGQQAEDLITMITRGTSFTEGTELLEEMREMQVLRITANGRLFRHNRPVPVSLKPYCEALCRLHDLRRGAHYHYDNCHQLLERCVLVQDYLLALPHRQLQQKTVLLAQLSLLVQDAYDVFSQFSERGWLLRLLNSVRDQEDFNRLDQMLVSALEAAGVDTSEQPLLDLKKPRSYPPQQQQLEVALKNLGGIAKLLRDPLSATIRLQSLLHHLPSGTNIDSLLQQEIDHYLSSQLWFSDNSSRPGSRNNSFNRLSSAGSSSSNGLNRGSSGGSGSGMLRRTSSIGARARTSLSVVEPFMVLRNDTVRTEWRQAFGGRERVTWREFWYKLVQPTAHIWGLDQQLDKFTTDYVQQHLQRGAHGLLTISELDFGFPPNTSPAMVIKAKLNEHQNTSSSLPAVTLVGSARPQCSGGSRDNWLRMLQEPVPRLHNFPEFPVGFNSRDDEVSELVLGMADVSTNLVMLTGAPGVGRSMLATSLAHDLVVTHHWTDAYWIDLQGVNNVVLAGQQLMAGLGLISDVPDTQQLLAWLEGRPRERFGIVLTHVQELLSAPAEEQHGFLDLLDNILHSSHKLQVVVVCDEPLPRITYLARQVEVQPLTAQAAAQMVQEAQPSIAEDTSHYVAEACQGAPVALAVICGLLRYGHCSATEFMRIYSDPSLPIERTISDTSSSSYLPFESRITNEKLQRILVAAAVALPDELVTGLLVLSLLSAPFSFEMAAPLLALPATNNERRSVMRRLVNLGLLSYNASLQMYTMHTLVRQAARLLVHNLGLPYVETRRRFAELLVSSARHLVLPLVGKNKMLSARLAWSRISVHVVQVLNWAFQEVREDMLQMYVALAWELMPLLSSSCGSHTLQGFCQVVVERAQFLDMNMESARVMTALGALLAESGALKRADTLLRQALEFFWRELKGPHPAVARCYRELGALLLKAGKAAEASKQLQACLEMQEQLFGGLSSELLPVLQLQVELLRRSRKYGEAEGVCQRALGICGAAYGPADVQVAVWKNQLAQVVRQAGRLTEAQSLAQESLALLQSQLGSEHPRVAAQLMMLGQLAAQQGKQAVAEQTYRKALQVYQAVSGLHHPDTFNCLTSLVSLLRGAGKASHALPLAQRCLAVKKKSLGELHPDTAASMQVVADVMLDLGRYAEVESHCSRAVWVYQQLDQPASSKPVIVATTMQALALVLLGRASEAEQLATTCLEAAKHMVGPAAERNSFVASCYNCLGEALREIGRVTEAEAAAREGLAMREKDLGSNHPIVAISLQTLGHILRMRQQLPEALGAAQRCEQLRASQAQGPPMAAALHLQALIYLDMGDLAEALNQGQAALAIRQKVLSSEHPDLAHSLTVVSEVLLMQGKHAEAEPLLSHAVQIFIAQLGSSHPATQRAHMLLKQATNPRTATLSMRLASADLGVRGPSASGSDVPSAAATRQPPSAAHGDVAAAPEQVQVTVPVTESTDLAPVLDEMAESESRRQEELEGPPTAPFIGAGRPVAAAGPVVPMLLSSSPTSLMGSSPPGTAGNNISIASKINNLHASSGASGSYAGYMSMGAESPPSRPSLAPVVSGVPAVQEEEEEQESSKPSEAAEDPAPAAADLEGDPAGALSRTASSMPSENAPAPADPSEWELGRQFGQPVSLVAGDASDTDAGARAYTKVLHELTRRSSISSESIKDNLLTATSNAASAAAAAAEIKSSGTEVAAAEAAEPLAVPAAPVDGPVADAVARDELTHLMRDSAALDAAAEAALTAEEDDKLKKLHGMGVHIEDLRSFLREHGWQLSRLSTDDREASASSTRAWQGSRESSYNQSGDRPEPMHPRALAAIADASDAPSKFRGAAAQAAEQKEGGGGGSTRRPPVRHFSFIGNTELEAVQESTPGSPTKASLAAPGNGSLEPADHRGVLMTPAPGVEQQTMQQQYLQQQQQQGPQWTGWEHEGSAAGEQQAAEAEELYFQQMAAAEAEAAAATAFRAEQNWAVAAQQAQMRARGAGEAATMGHEELALRLRQLQQQYGGLAGDPYALEEAAAFTSQVQQIGRAGWLHPQYPARAPRPRRRRDSWDVSYGPTHPLAQAAAAAAAQCGYTVSGGDSAPHMPLQQQQTAPVVLEQWYPQGQEYPTITAAGPHLAPLQTANSMPHGLSGALPGSGGSRASAHSGAFHPQGGPAAAAAAAAALLHGQRSGSTQYSPLSPAGSAAHADVMPGGLAGGRGPVPSGNVPGMPAAAGTLPKYPSNISSYSVGSGKSGGQGQHADGEEQHPMQQEQAKVDAHQGEQQYNVAAKARAALSGSQAHGEQHQAPTAPDQVDHLAASPPGTATSARSAVSSTAPSSRLRQPPRRNVSFKQQQEGAGSTDAAEHLDDMPRPPQSGDLSSPRADSAAAAAALRTARSAGMLRSKSPAIQQAVWDEQQHYVPTHHVPHTPAVYSGPLFTDFAEPEPLDAYHHGHLDMRSPSIGYGQQSLSRPMTAGSQGAHRGSAFTPTGPSRGTPVQYRDRSANLGQVPWADAAAAGDASRTQQLLLQQQVLQVQAARLELQQQQLEIEQLLNEQAQQQQATQHQHMQMAAQWPPGMTMPRPVAVVQQQRVPAGYYPGPVSAAPHVHGLPSYGPLQPATSSASTVSIHSPASPAPHQMQRGGLMEQAVDSSVAIAGPYSHLAHMASGPSPQSSMLTAGSSYAPSSPSASSSLSSRPPLSRGTSDNHEGQVAAASAQQQQQQQAAAALAAARGFPKQLPPQQQGFGVMRPGSPDGRVLRTPVTSSGPASGGSRQLQQALLHRLHKDNSYDHQGTSLASGIQHVNAALSNSSQLHGQQLMPAQQQQLLKQQFMQQQQMALQMQQQQQLATTALGRMGPGRQFGYNRPFNSMAMGSGPFQYPPTVAGQHMPGQPWPPGNRDGPQTAGGWGTSSFMAPGSTSGYGHGASASGPGSAASKMQGSVAAPPAGAQQVPGGRVPVSASAAGSQRTRPGPPSQGWSASAAVSGPRDPGPAARWAAQQQQFLQDVGVQGLAGGPAAYTGYPASESSGYPGIGQYPEPGSGTEDFEMWAAPPDYGQIDPLAVTSTGSGVPGRVGSGSRSFIAPGGGQYWEGRRSNSFGNLTEAASPASAAVARSLVRSKSSEGLPVAQEGDDEAWKE